MTNEIFKMVMQHSELLLQFQRDPELVASLWLTVTVLLLELWRVGRGKKERQKLTALEQRIAGFEEELEQTRDQARTALELAKGRKKEIEQPTPPSAVVHLRAEHIQSPVTPVAPVEVTPHTVTDGLAKTRGTFLSRLRSLFSGGAADREKLVASLEELLITSDLGVKATEKLLAPYRVSGSELVENSAIATLKGTLRTILSDNTAAEIVPALDKKPFVILLVGVNGVGKTTTIGKLAKQFKQQGLKVLLGACDTFRAAATEQLDHWAGQIGVEIVTGPEDSKPSTIAYQSVHRAIDEKFDVLILDTAGRLHTKVNLMNEIGALTSLVTRELPGAPHETILVVDASTGQNALQQAREFHSKLSLSGIILTKLDGTPKGGIVVAIKDELGVPIRYIGVGEGVADLRPFSADEFVEALFVDYGTQGSLQAEAPVTARGTARRRRREEQKDIETIH